MVLCSPIEERHQLRHEPAGAQEHVVLPRREEMSARGGKTGVGASQLVRIIHMDPAQVALSPVSRGHFLENPSRTVATTVLHHEKLDRLVCRVRAPAFDRSAKNRLIVERRDHHRQGGRRAARHVTHDGRRAYASRLSASGVCTPPGTSLPAP